LNTFSALGLLDELVETLGEAGITEPFAIQAATIRDTLEGRDVCGKAKTGSGKTLAFGLPLLQQVHLAEHRAQPAALILAPTRELASQIVEDLEALAAAVDVRIGAFYGGTDVERDITRLQRGVDVLVATPGRLIDLIERRAVSLGEIGIVVLDEADRMADMGFLPQVDWVLRHLGAGHCQMLLFSATLDNAVGGLVKRHLADPVLHEVEAEDDDVETMTHRFLAVHKLDRVKVAASIARGATRTIAFTRTKRGADRLAEQLDAEGVRVRAIHGDLRQSQRESALAAFEAGSIEVLVATDVAARGIHVDDIDVVVHFDPPEDHKAYLHRSGRTARAGRTGTVATFVLWDQHLEVDRIKKRLALTEPTIEVFSNDPRLTDLADMSTVVAAAS
jgi:superfamily II DNA/RNA helicase